MMDTINERELTLEEYEICNKIKKMRFSGMAEALEELFKNPNADLLPFLEKVKMIVDAEWDLRFNKKLNRYIKKATLKYPYADLDDTLYDPERQLDVRIIEEFSKCFWIDQGKNITITGKSGSGKTYLANALAICALRQFKNVKYIKASKLISDSTKAEKEGTIQDLIKEYSKYDLLVVDDFGLMSFDIDGCRNLFEIFDSRDPNRSTLIVSQLPISAWYDLFSDHTYAEACLSRLLSRSYRLEMNGKNMRNLEPLNK